MIAAESFNAIALGAAEPRPARVDIRATKQDLESIGATHYSSPPPGLSRNWVYLTQLGLLLAVGVLMWGGRIVGG